MPSFTKTALLTLFFSAGSLDSGIESNFKSRLASPNGRRSVNVDVVEDSWKRGAIVKQLFGSDTGVNPSSKKRSARTYVIEKRKVMNMKHVFKGFRGEFTPYA